MYFIVDTSSSAEMVKQYQTSNVCKVSSLFFLNHFLYFAEFHTTVTEEKAISTEVKIESDHQVSEYISSIIIILKNFNSRQNEI